MQVVGVSEDEQPVYTLSGGPFASRFRVDEDRVVEITEEGERLVFDLGARVGDACLPTTALPLPVSRTSQ